MIEGIDYCFITPKDNEPYMHIKLLDGPYKDTVYKYGKVKFEEKDDEMHLLFAFDVIESNKKLEKDLDFKNYIGNLLVEIMSANMDAEIEDETRTNDTENPYSQ
jgi:hypothetical protein